MAVTHVVSSPAGSATSGTVVRAVTNLPHAAGDLLTMAIIVKPETQAIPTPTVDGSSSGQVTFVGSAVVGTGAAGANAGQMRVAIYEVVDTNNTITSFSTAFSGTYSIATAHGTWWTLAAGESWDYSKVLFGSDTTSDTAYSVTTPSVPDVIGGDGILYVNAITNSAATLSGDTGTLSGVTFHSDGASEVQDGGSTLGNGIKHHVSYQHVTAGLGTSFLTFAGTLAAASTGGTAFIRVRSTTGQRSRPTSTVAAGGWTAVGAPTLHEAVDESSPSDTDYITVTV